MDENAIWTYRNTKVKKRCQRGLTFTLLVYHEIRWELNLTRSSTPDFSLLCPHPLCLFFLSTSSVFLICARLLQRLQSEWISEWSESCRMGEKGSVRPKYRGSRIPKSVPIRTDRRGNFGSWRQPPQLSHWSRGHRRPRRWRQDRPWPHYRRWPRREPEGKCGHGRSRQPNLMENPEKYCRGQRDTVEDKGILWGG